MRQELFKGINKMENIECYLLSTDKGIMVCGNDVEIRAMFSQIVYQLNKHGIKEEDLKRAFELGLMSNDEREEIAKEKLNTLLEKILGDLV